MSRSSRTSGRKYSLSPTAFSLWLVSVSSTGKIWTVKTPVFGVSGENVGYSYCIDSVRFLLYEMSKVAGYIIGMACLFLNNVKEVMK